MASRIARLHVIFCFAAALLFSWPRPAFADPTPFDLTGPKVEVKVTRGGQTLPITQVPNLAAGDKLWIHPDFPAGQAAHYLLVAAFLRGSTNPPPEDWFYRAETWNKKFDGLTIQDWGVTWDDIEHCYDKFEYLCGTSGKAGVINGKVVPTRAVISGLAKELHSNVSLLTKLASEIKP